MGHEIIDQGLFCIKNLSGASNSQMFIIISTYAYNIFIAKIINEVKSFLYI